MSKAAEQRKHDLLTKEKHRLNEKYGFGTGALASDPYKLNVIPTGIEALNYALGIGGWPRGHLVEVFGPPDIGKSSILGANMVRETQRMGLLPGIIAFEPNVDEAWLAKLGIDPELVVIARPDSAEHGVEILWDWVNGNVLDSILFDSLAAMPLEAELKDDAKKQAYGNSSMITFAVRRILMRAYKNNVFCMMINQVRDKQAGTFVTLDAPGGHAKEHACNIRVKLSPGKARYTLKQDGADVLVGQEVHAKVVRNKLSEGTGHVARFDFFQKQTEQFPFGVDTTKDIINTGKLTGVIEEPSAGNFVHDSFPPNKSGNKQIRGKAKVQQFFAEHPEVVETIHQEILNKMFEKVGEREAKQAEHNLRVVENE